MKNTYTFGSSLTIKNNFMKAVTLKNEICTLTFNVEAKSIYIYGQYANMYFKSENETFRGVKSACRELQNMFNKSTNIYTIVDFLSSKKIMMTLKLA